MPSFRGYGDCGRAVLVEEGLEDSTIALVGDAASVVALPCQALHCNQCLLERLGAGEVEHLPSADFQVCVSENIRAVPSE